MFVCMSKETGNYNPLFNKMIKVALSLKSYDTSLLNDLKLYDNYILQECKNT